MEVVWQRVSLTFVVILQQGAPGWAYNPNFPGLGGYRVSEKASGSCSKWQLTSHSLAGDSMTIEQWMRKATQSPPEYLQQNMHNVIRVIQTHLLK